MMGMFVIFQFDIDLVVLKYFFECWNIIAIQLNCYDFVVIIFYNFMNKKAQNIVMNCCVELFKLIFISTVIYGEAFIIARSRVVM